VYYYGLPDVTSLSADAPDAHQRLAREIEECIRVYEPRLVSARVLVAPAGDSRERRVRFVIDGVLRMDPHTERILLDTVLETPTGKFLVAGDAHA
jgi:type VI secretion system lysozyme-like protein